MWDSINKDNITLESFYVTDGKSYLQYQTLSEAEKMKFGKDVVRKLFNTIKNKSLKIDYCGIESSKGDITKFAKYSDLENSIRILNNMYKSDPSVAPTEIPKVVRLMDVIKKYKNDFVNAFNSKNQVVIILYTNMVATLIAGTSKLIISAIEYVKSPTGEFRAIFKQNCKDELSEDIYLKSIDRFLKSEVKGELKQILTLKSLKESFELDYDDNTEPLNEGAGEALSALGSIPAILTGVFTGNAITIGIGVVLVLIGLLWTVKHLIFAFYYNRTKLSQYLLTQSYFIEQHAQGLDTTTEKGKKAYEKQMKTVEKLRKMSEAIKVKDKADQKKAKEESEKDDKETSKDSKDTNSDNNDVLL